MTENGNNLYFSKNMARVSVIFFFFNVRTFNIFDLIIAPLEYFNLCQNISEQLFVNEYLIRIEEYSNWLFEKYC